MQQSHQKTTPATHALIRFIRLARRHNTAALAHGTVTARTPRFWLFALYPIRLHVPLHTPFCTLPIPRTTNHLLPCLVHATCARVCFLLVVDGVLMYAYGRACTCLFAAGAAFMYTRVHANECVAGGNIRRYGGAGWCAFDTTYQSGRWVLCPL